MLYCNLDKKNRSLNEKNFCLDTYIKACQIVSKIVSIHIEVFQGLLLLINHPHFLQPMSLLFV